ncbi:PEP-CTERM sorting domain-containing protein [Falsiroseomonas oryzae]|uniref:PEP-CTERM sorting domain-containing protein n=1 Tax=Falsiroseomonas oryzae TaxID=2766473 RepID=UPI0022EBA1ED|nr:PEP-CTERM sorting domain-containing protein [Roseomonas sp. MO-31]
MRELFGRGAKVVAAACVALALAAPAGAATLNWSIGQQWTSLDGNLRFTAEGCGTFGPISCASIDIVETQRGFILTGDNGAPLLNATQATGLLDYLLDIRVERLGGPPLEMWTLAFDAAITEDGFASIGEAVGTPPANVGSLGALNVELDSAFSIPTATLTFLSQNSLILTKDIKADPGLDGTAVIFSVTQVAVPEPASLAAFGAALVGLAGLHGRRRRKAARAA